MSRIARAFYLLLLLSIFLTFAYLLAQLREVKDKQRVPIELGACETLGYCSFRGKCHNFGGNSAAFCVCEDGFNGNDCSESKPSMDLIFPSCKTRACNNGGVCFIKGADGEQCLCPAGFTGDDCSLKEPF